MEGSYAALVTTYNEEKLLPRCLVAIESQIFKPSHLIVVDDGSRDHTPEILNGYDAICIDEPKYDEGYKNRARAFNVGLKHALKYVNWKYLLKVDADIIIPENYAETLLRWMGEKVGVASGSSSGYINKRWISNGAVMYRRCTLRLAPLKYAWDRSVATNILRQGYGFKVVPGLLYTELRPPRIKSPPLWRVLKNRVELKYLTLKYT